MREFNEGFGTDFESEVVEGRKELDAELDEFESSWKTPENSESMDLLMEQLRENDNPEEVRQTIKELSAELSESMGDEDINNIISKRARGNGSEIAESDSVDDYE